MCYSNKIMEICFKWSSIILREGRCSLYSLLSLFSVLLSHINSLECVSYVYFSDKMSRAALQHSAFPKLGTKRFLPLFTVTQLYFSWTQISDSLLLSPENAFPSPLLPWFLWAQHASAAQLCSTLIFRLQAWSDVTGTNKGIRNQKRQKYRDLCPMNFCSDGFTQLSLLFLKWFLVFSAFLNLPGTLRSGSLTPL